MVLTGFLLMLGAAHGLTTENTLKYPVNIHNLPDVGAFYRVKQNSELKIPIIIPKDGDVTYFLFTQNYRDALKIKNSRKACARNLDDEECNPTLTTTAKVIFKVTESAFSHAKLGFPNVDEDDAELDRDSRTVLIKNANPSNGGFWWSTFGKPIAAQNSTDIELSFRHDKMSLVQVVDSCAITVQWDDEIDFDKFGWKQTDKGPKFNAVGFKPNDVFATCFFKSSPPTYLKWDNIYVSDKGGYDEITARVPDHHIEEEFVECSVEEFSQDWDFDECEEGLSKSVHKVLAPPSAVEYSYNPNSIETVWKYYNILDEYEVSPVTFSCPYIEGADSTIVVSRDAISENLIGNSPIAVPWADADSPDDNNVIVQGSLEEDSNGKRFNIAVYASKLKPKIHEFRCAYGFGEQLLGYSKPVVLYVYEEDVDHENNRPVDYPKVSWGDSISEYRILKESKVVENIANCFQKTGGRPSALQFGFINQEGNEIDQKFPPLAVIQHSISLNLEPRRHLDKAGIFCKSFKNVGNETQSENVALGQINVITKPYKLHLHAIRINFNWTVHCHADVSSYDVVDAALTLNTNYKVELNQDGTANFNIEQDFTKREQERFLEKGTKCIYYSKEFPEERFETEVWTVIKTRPDGGPKRGWPWGILLMLGGLVAILSMCIGWNKPDESVDENEDDKEAQRLNQ